jgi:hypothetical protein
MLPATKKEAVAGELQSLVNAGMPLLPEEVIEAARNPNSTMHSMFEWDDTEAAIKYRLAQARWIIRNVEIVVERVDAKTTIAPAFTFSGTKGYLPTQVVIKTEGRIALAVRTLRSCESQLERCACPELDDAISMLRSLRSQLESIT